MNKGNLKSELQEIVKKCINSDEENDIGEFTIYDNRYELIEELNLENWPKVDDGEGHMENIDLENFEIIDITDDKLTVFAGGDWQDPIQFSIIKTPTGNRCEIHEKVTKHKELTTYEFLRKLFDIDNPETILSVKRKKIMDWWEFKKWGEK